MALDFVIPDVPYSAPTTALDFWIRDLTPDAPVVSPASFSVSEDASLGTLVGTVEATDANGDDLTFSIAAGNVGGAFAIDPDTGEITVAAALDYETTPSYTLTVVATDPGSLYGSASISIAVLDVPEVVLPPAPALILGVGLPWSRAQPRDRDVSLAWSPMRVLDIEARTPWAGGAVRDILTGLAWRQPAPLDVAAPLPWAEVADPRDRAVAVVWRQPPARDIGTTMLWGDADEPRDRASAIVWRQPPAKDIGTTVLWRDLDPSPPAGAWAQAPVVVRSGPLLLDWPRQGLDFRIRMTAPSSYGGSLDFAIPVLPPDELAPPLLLSWAPLRAPQLQPVAVDRLHALPWIQGVSRDRSADLVWGRGTPINGDPIEIPWESEPPEPTWIVVPPLPVYNVANSISVVRLPERTPIDPLAVSLSYDDEAFCWRCQMTLFDAAQVALLSPVGGVKEAEVTINGFVAIVAVESFSRDRQFPKTTWTMTGRTRSAYLDEPYEPARSLVSTGLASAEQLALDELPAGWTLDWDVPDWPVPAGAWSYDRLTPVKAIARLAAAAGAVIEADPSAQHLRVRSRFPASPADWPTTSPDVSIPDALCTRMGSSYSPGIARNAVIVEGATQGVRVEATRLGTGGDVPAPAVTEDLCTDVTAGQERARVELDGTGTWSSESIAIPVLPSPGVILPGQLLEVTDGGVTWRGLVRSVDLSASRSDRGILVGQTLTVARKMPDVPGGGLGPAPLATNLWSRFRALLGRQPQQVVEVITVHDNGTSTVESAAGNQWIVLGDSVAEGSFAVIQDGRIIAAAAERTTYTVSV